ncbi:MAG TPA: oligosaccharide flippase family protein [Chitinophagales bacterium]|nr:oligosaccharide flippase family protein [Chitinophagales bacterium]
MPPIFITFNHPMGIVKRQSIQASVISYIGVLIGYVNLIYLFPEFLSPDQFGLTRLIISVSVVFSQFSLLGTTVSILRFFPYLQDKRTGHHGLLSFLLLISMAGFVVFSALLLLLHAPVTNLFIDKSAIFVDYYYYVFPLSFFLMVYELFYMYMRAIYKNVVAILIKEVVLRLLQTGALLMLVYGWVDFDGFFLLFIGSYLVHLVAILVYTFYLKQLFIFSKIDFMGLVSVRQVIRYSMFMFVAALAAYYTSNIDQIMIGSMIGVDSNAVYAIAFFIGTMIQIPGRAMNQVALPIITESWKQHNLKKLQEIYSQTSLNQLIIGGFIFLVVWINIDLLLSTLKDAYLQVKPLILIVGLGKLFDLATGANAEILVLSKHSKITMATYIFLIIASTLANLLLIPLWGLIGSAVATSVSLILYNLIRMVFLYATYRLQPFSNNTLKACLLLVSSFGIYYLLPDTPNKWFNGFYQTAFVTLAMSVSLVFFRISPEIMASYNWAREKLNI